MSSRRSKRIFDHEDDASMPRRTKARRLNFLLLFLVAVVALTRLSKVLPMEQLSLAYQYDITETNNVTTTTIGSEETIEKLQQRLGLLETKLNSYLNFDSDPFLNTKVEANCKYATDLNEYCPEYKKKRGCMIDMKVCLDDLSDWKGRCIVYDFGIREQPDFGEILSQTPFNCHVYAFDPSPITKQWYERSSRLKDNPNYHLFFYGAGAKDETIELKEYNWDQVSIYRYPLEVVDKSRFQGGHCEFKHFPVQATHALPVRGLASIMAELGHTHIDILKLDIEGSEYRFLEPIIESGLCRQVDQIALEWHHFNEDSRYGQGSSPQMNMFTSLLKRYCGLTQFHVSDSYGGWPAQEEVYQEMGITLRYTLSSFMREPQ